MRLSASLKARRPALTARPTRLVRLVVRFLVAMLNLHQNARAERLTHRIRMGPLVTPTAPERHLIKKYANRKLYDTRASRYITLEGIAQLVRDGHEIKVVDSDHRDLTQLTLSQVVTEEEKRGPARFVDAGGEMLHDRGQALLEYVRKTLNVPADIRHEVGRRRENLEIMADDAMEQTLRRLRIPTRRDIDRINERLDRISAQLKKAGLADGATKRSRKRKASR
jgi:polyhydroxyalkanoate synthesis repressor PhaR